MTVPGQAERELAEALQALRLRDAELSAARQQAADLAQELEETSRGLIALHAELEQARQDAARLAAIVEWSTDAMFSLSPDGVIETWNPGAERMLGYTADEITGHPAAALLPGELAGEFAALLDRAAAGELAVSHETRSQRKDGSQANVAATCSAIRDPGGELAGFAVLFHDITALLAAEAELAAARAEQQVLAERDRMARDLHDRVIQRVFAAGMSLHTAARTARNPDAATRIETVIGDLDTAIDEIRETIFTLRRPARQAVSLRDEILTLATDAAIPLGFTPAVTFDGPADGIPGDVSAHLLAVCREALSNIARHAHATAATVTVSTGAGTPGSEVLLQVADNGRGLGDTTRSSGLRNMRERAEMLGGGFQITSEPGGGTRLEWRVPF